MLKFDHYWIRLIAVLMLLNTVAIASPPASTEAVMSYYCGDVEFPVETVSTAIKIGLKKYYAFKASPVLYDGPLYGVKTDSLIMFPIVDLNAPAKSTSQEFDYFVIFGWPSGAVRVIARAPDDDRECSRQEAGSSPPPPFIYHPRSSDLHKATRTPNNNHGYKCGQKFISNVIISKAVTLAKFQTFWKINRYFRSKTSITTMFQYRLWLVNAGENIHGSGNNGGLIIYILTDQIGNLKNVVATVANTNQHYECEFSVNPSGGHHNTIKVEPETVVEHGYQCGRRFFEMDRLVSETNLAKIPEFKRRRHFLARYPEKYSGDPFTTDVLLWPVSPSETSHSQENTSWFLVMDMEFKVECVAVKRNNTYKCCKIHSRNRQAVKHPY